MKGVRSAERSAVAPLVCAILPALLLAGCAAQPPATDVEKPDRVLGLIQQCLGYMNEASRQKWDSGAPLRNLALGR